MSQAARSIALWSGLVLLSACARRHPAPQSAPTPAHAPGADQTGAIDSVPAAALHGRQADDVAELLEGRVAGLQVIRGADGSISLHIRGMDSITGDGEALVVLDGMPVEPRNVSFVLQALSPKDVQSIEVLKDVASTSAYGMRGANGVVVIRTKRR